MLLICCLYAVFLLTCFFFSSPAIVTLKFRHTRQITGSRCLQGRHQNDALRWQSSPPSAGQSRAVVMALHSLCTVQWSWCCGWEGLWFMASCHWFAAGAVTGSSLTDCMSGQSWRENEQFNQYGSSQHITPCWLPLITLNGEKSFKSNVWLLNQLQLGYKHKLKAFLAVKCQQRCLFFYRIRLLSVIIIWSAAQNDETHYDCHAWLCDSHTFTNTGDHKVGIIMFSGILFFYSTSYIHVITFDQIDKVWRRHPTKLMLKTGMRKL